MDLATTQLRKSRAWLQKLVRRYPEVVQKLSRSCPEVVQELSKSCPRRELVAVSSKLSRSFPGVVQELFRSDENQLAGHAAIQVDWSASPELSRSCPEVVQELSRTPKQWSNPSLQSRSPIAEVVQKLSRSCPGNVHGVSWLLLLQSCPGVVQKLSRSCPEVLKISWLAVSQARLMGQPP